MSKHLSTPNYFMLDILRWIAFWSRGFGGGGGGGEGEQLY